MNRTAIAWLLMVTSVGIHVIDEAVTGGLALTRVVARGGLPIRIVCGVLSVL